MKSLLEGFAFKPSQSATSIMSRSFDEEEMKEIQLPRTMSTPVPGPMSSRSRSAPMSPQKLAIVESVDESTATESNLDDSIATRDSGSSDSNEASKKDLDDTPSSIQVIKHAVPTDEDFEIATPTELDDNYVDATTMVVVAAEDSVQEIESFSQKNDVYSSPSRCQKVLEWSTVREVTDSLGNQEVQAAKAPIAPDSPNEKVVPKSDKVRKAAADMETPTGAPVSSPDTRKPRRVLSGRIAALQAKLNLQPGLKIPSSRLNNIKKLHTATTDMESQAAKTAVTSKTGISGPVPSQKIKTIALDLESRLPFLQNKAPGVESHRNSSAMSPRRVPSSKIQAAATDLVGRLVFRQPKEETMESQEAKSEQQVEPQALPAARSEDFQAVASALSAKLSFRLPRTESEVDLDTQVSTDCHVLEDSNAGEDDCVFGEGNEDRNSTLKETKRVPCADGSTSDDTSNMRSPGSILLTSVDVSLNNTELASAVKKDLTEEQASAMDGAGQAKKELRSLSGMENVEKTATRVEKEMFVDGENKDVADKSACLADEADSQSQVVAKKERMATKYASSDMGSVNSARSSRSGQTEGASKKEEVPVSATQTSGLNKPAVEKAREGGVRKQKEFLQLEFEAGEPDPIKVVSKTAPDDASVATEQSVEVGLLGMKTLNQEESYTEDETVILGDLATNSSKQKQGRLRRSLKRLFSLKKKKEGRPPLPKSPSRHRLGRKDGPSFMMDDVSASTKSKSMISSGASMKEEVVRSPSVDHHKKSEIAIGGSQVVESRSVDETFSREEPDEVGDVHLGSSWANDRASRVLVQPTHGGAHVKRFGSKRGTIRGDQVFQKRESYVLEEKKEESGDDITQGNGRKSKSSTHDSTYKNPFDDLPSLSAALGESNVMEMFSDGLLCLNSGAGGTSDNK